ncbi:MFS transporter [Microbacterium sp. NPDC089698]|uniref:MFS transporter n=1 Tax=Microbacterium sp. NPDC089698 TaxID=3364200 RepID=UPI0038049B86
MPKSPRLASSADDVALSTVDSDRLSLGKTLAWCAPGMSYVANVLILGYITIYATDTLRIPAAIVGTLLLVAKVLDAFGTLFAGWIVDRSPVTRLGKARPYDLAILGMWLFTGVLFSATADWSLWLRIGWLFIAFVLNTAVFGPLFTGAGLLYMARALPTRQVWAKASSRGGLLSGLTAIVVSTALPVMLGMAGKSGSGWSVTIWMFSVPFAALGLIRFFTVKEKYETERPDMPKVTLREIVSALRSNGWLWVIMGIQLFAAIVGNIGASAYYFRYLVGDLSLAGALAPLGLIVLPLLLLLPRLMRRFTVSRLVMYGMILGTIGYLIYFVANGNLVVLFIGGAFVGIAAVPLSFLLPLLLLDSSAMNEARGRRRLESTNGALANFAQNLGSGISSGLAGWLLGLAGYDGALHTQPPSALFAIAALMGLIPAVISVFAVILALLSNRWEKQMPDIREQLAARHAQAEDPNDGPQRDAAQIGTNTMAIVTDTTRGPIQEGGTIMALKASREAADQDARERESRP